MSDMRVITSEGNGDVNVHHNGQHICLSMSEGGDTDGLKFEDRSWVSTMINWPREMGRRVAEAILAMDNEVVSTTNAPAPATAATLNDWMPSPTTSFSPGPTPEAKRAYIGDSVYATFDGFMLTLYTDNGAGPTNTVCLEQGLLERVVEFRDTALQQLKSEAEAVDDAEQRL